MKLSAFRVSVLFAVLGIVSATGSKRLTEMFISDPQTQALTYLYLELSFFGLSALILYACLRFSRWPALERPPRSTHPSTSSTVRGKAIGSERTVLAMFFNYLAKSTNDIILLMDTEGRIVEANDRAVLAYGYSREELLRHSIADLRAPENLQDQPGEWEQAAQPAGISFETVHRRKNNSVFPVEVSSRILEIDGQIFRQSIVRDTSKRKQSEEHLKKSLHFRQQLLEKIPNPIWYSGLDDHRDYLNQAWLDFTGRMLEQELGDGWLAGVHSDDREHCLKTYREALACRQPFMMEYRLHHCSGQYRWISETGQPFYDLDGIFSGYLGACLDIHEHKLHEERLQHLSAQVEKQARMLDTILSATPDLVMMWDLHGLCLYANASATNSLGLKNDHMVGRSLQGCQLVPHEAGVLFEEGLKKVIETGMPFNKEMTLALGEGEKDFEYVLTPVRGINGRVEAVVSTVRDITERNQAALRISQLNEELERKVEMRTEELIRVNARLELWAKELQQRNREMILLGEMTDLLQTCNSLEEAYPIIERFAAKLFLGQSGNLFLFDDSGSLLESAVFWGTRDGAVDEQIFTRDRCWALRRSEIHLVVSDKTAQPRCDHVRAEISYLCLPLLAHGEALGVLHVKLAEEIAHDDALLETQRRLAQTVRDRLALALSNLKLRQTLRHLSLQDSVTGLYNRRFMEEAIKLQILRAKRAHSPLSIVMMDIDHFKQINDGYGHDTGDAVLRGLADLLQRSIRQSDVACRFGGEEFILLLPDTPTEVAERRAEALRVAVEKMALQYDGKTLDQLTVSLGVATYPDNGLTLQALIKVADTALYNAKETGRNRVCLAESLDP
jgi:diguanylate cyclase (GGDEF)-like protein/PAS domain S-box-containing protein